MEYLVIFLASAISSTAIIVFSVVKGGINKRSLYTDNSILFLGILTINLGIFYFTSISVYVLITVINGFITLILYIVLLLFRFYRNPRRIIPGDPNDIVSGADGRVIYIKELEENQMPVSVKKIRISELSEITKTDLLKRPCYLIGIAMTLFDVHYNRAPLDGEVVMIKHTDGTAIGLNTPVSTVSNERNTVVFQREDGVKTGIVQIAARGVRRCIISIKEGEKIKRGEIIGKIRWGSQFDMIVPRNSEILIREGDQVYAGTTIIAKLLS
jgi:phosphatidylserine decarboxylase